MMKSAVSGILLIMLLANVPSSAFRLDPTANSSQLKMQIETDPILFPLNGHYYQAIAVQVYVTWAEAKTQAESLNFSGIYGHLATINSMNENNFIINNLGGPTVLNRYWLGGFQPPGSPEPAGNWHWVTEEPWNFTNWASGEPSNHYGGEYGGAPHGSNEEVLHFFRNNGQWNDMEETSFQPGFIVEYEGQLPELEVYVVDSCNSPIANALVEVADLTAYSNDLGSSLFHLTYGTYNVSASHSDYSNASWTVGIDGDKNITLTLSFPYAYEGEILNSTIIITPVQSGYNITLLNNLVSSEVNVFFDWSNMGAIPPGTWGVFIFDHLPNLIVEAASKGSDDYPKAWYKHPLPIQLVPATGDEGAFPAEPIPYAAGSIFVIPYPPVYGQEAVIGVILHNPYEHILNVSRVDFQISGLTVGGYFTSVGYLPDVSLQANETRVLSVNWNATVTGHHCVRVVLTFSPTTQSLQRNLDVEYAVIQGETGEVSFVLVNPFQAAKQMTIKVNKQLSTGSEATLEIEGRVYDTSSDVVIETAPGQELHATLSIQTSNTELENGVVDIEAYIDGQLIGGLRKKIETVPITYPQFIGYYLTDVYGVRIPDQTANFDEFYNIVILIKNPDVVTHVYTIDLTQTSVSTPIGAVFWNWQEPFKTIMATLGVPTQWNTDPEWTGETQETEIVAPKQTVEFVFTVKCKWRWIPPWNWKYLLSTVIWIAPGALKIATLKAIGDIIKWTKPLGLLAQLQGIGTFVRNEQFGFKVSYGSTILGVGGARVTMPYSDPKVQDYVASLVCSLAAAVDTFVAISAATTGLGVPLAVGAALAEAGTIALQNWIYSVAADPTSEYTEVVQPVPLTLLNGTKVIDLPAVKSLNGTMYNVIETLIGVLEYQNATGISIDKYTTAKAAGDVYYQNLQLQAVTTYACQRDLLLASYADQLYTLCSMLEPINSSALADIQEYLSENGLPVEERELLTGLGLSSSIPDITVGMQVLLDVTLLNETELSQFSMTEGAQSVQSLLMEETYGWEQQPSPGLPHNIAVTDIATSSNRAYQGRLAKVNVTLTNSENFTEIRTLCLFYNGTQGDGTIWTQMVVLYPYQIETLTLLWNTTGLAYGNYTIWAQASPILNETSTTDNTLADGWVIVTIPGDVDGNFKVDIFDVVKITSCYGKKRGDLLYNPNADIDDDGVINIFDVVLCTGNYGKKYP